MDVLVNRDINKPGYGDIVFENGFSPSTPYFVDSVAQRVFIMLRTFEEEWYLNESTGVPYLQQILGKKVKKVVVDRIIQEKVLAENGVAGILEFSSTLNNRRVYEARLKIQTTTGDSFIENFNIQEI